MDFKEIIEYKLIEFDKYSFSVFNILIILIIVIGTWIFSKLLKRIMLRKKSKSIVSAIDTKRKHAAYKLVNYFLWVIAIVFCIQSSGFDITILLAGSAALLVGIGMGVQQLFNDFICGVILLFEGTISVGDVVEVDGMIATVQEIKIRTSQVITREDIVIIIPNHKLINDNVINWSQNRKAVRFNVNVGVAYGSDIELVKKLLLEVAHEHPEVVKDEIYKPFVRFINFGESSLDFQIFFYSKEKLLFENIKSDLRFLIDKKFRENNITIPFPQRTLHFKSGVVEHKSV
jgi:small-conductance mechanosensitive channel